MANPDPKDIERFKTDIEDLLDSLRTHNPDKIGAINEALKKVCEEEFNINVPRDGEVDENF